MQETQTMNRLLGDERFPFVPEDNHYHHYADEESMTHNHSIHLKKNLLTYLIAVVFRIQKKNHDF